MALRMRRSHDSDSSSSFCNPLDEEDGKQQDSKEPQHDEDCPWRSAVDPSSGKTYYYHIKTRETQWLKPLEMASREEKEALAAKERRQKEFFAAMEANILQSIAQGFKAPEKKNLLAGDNLFSRQFMELLGSCLSQNATSFLVSRI